MTASASKWNDLWVRVASAVAMLAIGGVEVWLGGLWFNSFVGVIIGLMMWELVRMLTGDGRHRAVEIGVVSGAVMVALNYVPAPVVLPAIAGIVVAGAALTRTYRKSWLLYAPMILLSGYALCWIRDGLGIEFLIWLLCVVIASDVAGYFAGRLLGGPKFWPAISPKKTWSGTVAGWVGAAVVGAYFVHVFDVFFDGAAQPALVVLISVLVALAAQMGDIVESAIKRRVGVKDSSALIPGHGGLLDRFDALIGASLVVLALGVLL
ncbi:phosphatidate cytidylyltransferase [Lutimaribacter sp. EGI FJ00015]|uniref:Phosphatidate cytidylyltransferase n=1 Tax=Lutimaribacter degradans TaxID=2945989 RepID=A0ACC5ZVV7_9RHOB|nr:phosphatidate cytidylyltransferase [Lutimaribacter sp. EGI FJ00013]MCM2562459.1 phosphatidate cytidylyltransferase [Lutimaribacter sp. EGI FJ00013]MCO0613616.1 phosphatidate cytidylyltransferase [Lutimaribacter sp. EGI FJ00015]MCO0636588.1 phosphatidate cytidylyltransferase [Lutimaribacter sp. EGI FJ00014]